MSERTTQLVNLAYWSAQVLLVATCGLGIAALVAQQRALNAVVHTHEIKAQLEHLLNRLVDAETGQRGYLLAGAPEFLTPYRDAVSVIDRQISTVASLTADNATQRAAIPPLRAKVHARLELLARSIALHERGDTDGALAIVRSGDGMRLMQEIRADLARMDAEETRLLVERTHRAQRFGPAGWLVLITLGILSLGFTRYLRRAAARERAESITAHENDRRANARLEARVEERTQELQEANADLQAFAHSVAHDLRAPLRNIQGYATAIIEDEGPRLSDEGALYARRMAESAGRLDGLIQDLLAYSRLSRVQIGGERVELAGVMEHVVRELASEIALREALVTIQPPLPAVRAHRATLAQVVTNLLSNALKFVAPDSTPVVTISAERDAQRVRLFVRDNGIGIAADHQERIFRVFERLHGSETYPGTGIGLAIVRRGVERMGGRVEVQSTPGAGSRFCVELPAADAA